MTNKKEFSLQQLIDHCKEHGECHEFIEEKYKEYCKRNGKDPCYITEWWLDEKTIDITFNVHDTRDFGTVSSFEQVIPIEEFFV